MPVGGSPRVVKLALEDVGPNDSGDSCQKILADNGVLGRFDAEGGMLIAETLDSRKEGSKVVDVGCVGVDCTSESLSLITSL